jgi:SNF2-related domain
MSSLHTTTSQSLTASLSPSSRHAPVATTPVTPKCPLECCVHRIVDHDKQYCYKCSSHCFLFHQAANSSGQPRLALDTTAHDLKDIVTIAYCLLQWEVVIVDEGHRLKNDQSRLAGALAALSTRARFLLTGTPLQNRLGELWALLNFLLPSVFSSAASFDAWFGDAFCGNAAVSVSVSPSLSRLSPQLLLVRFWRTIRSLALVSLWPACVILLMCVICAKCDTETYCTADTSDPTELLFLLCFLSTGRNEKESQRVLFE